MQRVNLNRKVIPEMVNKSNWIWPCGMLDLQNCYAQFRYDFQLDKIPEAAPVFLTADQSYRFYVNGYYVCRGPARGYQESWPIDEVEIRDFLQKGHNWFSVEAYNPGIGTFQYIHESYAGFLCAAEWGKIRIHTHAGEWQMRRAPGNRAGTARLSLQMGFQEDFDASCDDLAWIFSPAHPKWIMKPYDLAISETPFGRPPWISVESRGIPMLRENIVTPECIAVYGTGKMKRGWRTCQNIAWHWQGFEEMSVTEWKKGAELSVRHSKGKMFFTVPQTEGGQYTAVSIDLGAIRTGSFYLALENCSGGEIADCLFFQYLKDGIPETRIPTGCGQIGIASRLRTSKGRCERFFYSIFGARYVVLILRGFHASIRVETSWRNAEYPFSMKGTFKSSDKILDKIYELCRHTQQICSIDAYVDTPWREQGQWWADARIQAKNTFYLDGDSRLLRRGIDIIAGQHAALGLVCGVAPCRGGGCILPDFALVWILTIWDYYWQTGSMEPFEKHFNQIQKIFRYFDTPETRGENGLLKFDSRCWLFEDWAKLPKCGYPTYLNLFHLYILIHYEKLLRISGRISEADQCAEDCRSRKILLKKNFFDEKEGLFSAGRDLDGTVLSEPSVHDQVLAVLNDMCPNAWKSMIEKRFLPFLRGDNVSFATPTSYWCSYLFDATEKLCLNAETLNFIRNKWRNMIPYGGTWEHLVLNEATGQSCCHAWSAHPAVHIVNLLTGLRQEAPAWSKISILPDEELLSGSGTISLPLPLGDFVFLWKNKQWEVKYSGKCSLRKVLK